MPKEVKEIAGSVSLWIIAFAVISIVIFQCIIFMRIAKKTAPEVGMTSIEVKKAIKTGFISSLGPSFGIAIVIISLIKLLGSPITMMRIGIIGSASTEAGAAEVGAKAFGVSLGSDAFIAEAFTTVVWTMCVGGMGWLFFAFFFTKSLGTVQTKLANKNPKAMAIVSSAAMMGAFGYLAIEKMVISLSYAVSGLAGLIMMFILLGIAKKTNKAWIKEWALGIAMVVGMACGYCVSFV
ncbi:DUF5058 family protein [Lentibacillus daqui]|uniref:DUF5058 family protein n=1 Tax=Lentibacillus daqui TaxID=2911514 RepID=UPI0022B0F347|nr:DUF5058 family protein [Lentibacillus daqui]